MQVGIFFNKTNIFRYKPICSPGLYRGTVTDWPGIGLVDPAERFLTLRQIQKDIPIGLEFISI